MRHPRAVPLPAVAQPPPASPILALATPGYVPAVSCWPGEHAFRVTVCQRSGALSGRQPPFVYSAATGKLYTGMLVAVPFRFAYAGVREPAEMVIRALPVYCEPHNMQIPVRRCALHRDAAHPANVDVRHVSHVLRAQHPHVM